jgi:hypothetical protein
VEASTGVNYKGFSRSKDHKLISLNPCPLESSTSVAEIKEVLRSVAEIKETLGLLTGGMPEMEGVG